MANDRDSSHGRAIETPTPRSMVRREMFEADVLNMEKVLSEKVGYTVW
jgi:hypothetical protein